MYTVLLTGATSGIGYETAKELAKKHYTLILINRSAAKTRALNTELEQLGAKTVDSYLADLSNMKEVDRVAREVISQHSSIDVLLNNAGFIAGDRTETAEGLESTFATNHLAPFLLTGRLLPLVQNSSLKRVVNVASRAHKWAKPDMEDLQMMRKYKPLECYCNSKLYNILHIRKLAVSLKDTDSTCFALHPGAVSTGFGKTSSPMLKLMVDMFRPLMLSSAKGAVTPIRLCLDTPVGAPSGTYFEKDKPFLPFGFGTDDRMASELWEKSIEILETLGIETTSLYKM